jgi:hypothetical protein
MSLEDTNSAIGERRDGTGRKTNLTRPEGDDGTERIAGLSLGGPHLGEGSTEGDGEGAGRTCLNLDLGHLEGAECDIGEDFSRGGTGEPDEGLVLFGSLLTSKVHVGILEDFVETVLEHSLERVADEGGAEALPETPRTFLSTEELQGRNEAVVLGRVDLAESRVV